MKRSLTTPQPPPFARVLIFGRTGTGKTTCTTSWPDPLICDGDGSSSMLYAKHPTLKILPTKSYRDVLDTLDDLASRNELPKTVVIDGAQFYYAAIADAHPEDTYKTEINREFREFVERLFAYPCHVVFTASEKEIYAHPGDKIPLGENEFYIVKPTDSIPIGYRPEIPQMVEHLADFIFRFTGDEEEGRQAIVFAQRGSAFSQRVFENLTAQTILDAIAPAAAATDQPPSVADQTVAPSLEEIQNLGKQLNAMLPKGSKMGGIRAYAKSKRIAAGEELNDEVRTQLKVALEADIAACEKRSTVHIVKTDVQPAQTTAPAAAAAANIGRNKYGTPRHERYAS